MKTRHRYIDVAKGLGILLVVFGHNRVVGPQHPELFALVYSVHMPLFIFLSGSNFRPDVPLLELARRRWRTLLRPYFFTLLLVLLAFFVAKYRFDLQQLGSALLRSLYGTGRTLPWQWLWFLPFLFIVNLSFAALMRVLPTALPVRIAVFAALLVGGVLFARALWLYPTPFGELLGLPFSVDLLGIGLFYFWLGYEFGQRQQVWGDWLQRLALLIVLGFAALHVASNATMDLNYRYYGHIPIVTAMAVLGIAGTLALSKLLVRYGGERVVQACEYLGTRTLVIYIFHVFLQAKSLFVAVEILGLSYWPASVLSFAGGVIAPLLLGELLLRRLPVLRDIYFPSTGQRASGSPVLA